jgi:hypothetical protein
VYISILSDYPCLEVAHGDGPRRWLFRPRARSNPTTSGTTPCRHCCAVRGAMCRVRWARRRCVRESVETCVDMQSERSPHLGLWYRPWCVDFSFLHKSPGAYKYASMHTHTWASRTSQKEAKSQVTGGKCEAIPRVTWANRTSQSCAVAEEPQLRYKEVPLVSLHCSLSVLSVSRQRGKNMGQ